MISSDELTTLKQCCGQFISVNSFFSTSVDKNQALSFLSTSNATINLEPILFEIDADPTLANTKPFADISTHSHFSGESEVLFMLGSIFRLNSIDHSSNDQVWIIRMTLCSDDEHDLEKVLINMKQQFGCGETNLLTLGKLLWEMSKLDLAEKYFIRLLEQLPPDDPSLGALYQDLGKLTSQAGDLDKSMKWRKKAIALQSETNQYQANLLVSPASSKKLNKGEPIIVYIPDLPVNIDSNQLLENMIRQCLEIKHKQKIVDVKCDAKLGIGIVYLHTDEVKHNLINIIEKIIIEISKNTTVSFVDELELVSYIVVDNMDTKELPSVD
ncbi:unnamed protein product, partial [Rotaria socialis]